MIEAFNIMQDRLTRMRLAGDPPDIHITPHIGHIGWLDFHRAARGDRGRQGRHRKGVGADRSKPSPRLAERLTAEGPGENRYCEGDWRAQVV